MGSTLRDNRDLACYFITKHSWKGKYVFSSTVFHNFVLFCQFVIVIIGFLRYFVTIDADKLFISI